MTVYFVAQKLKVPALRFSSSSSTAVNDDARRGLKNYGPYDSGMLGKDSISAGIIYPTSLNRAKDLFANGINNGSSSFAGFKQYFRIPLNLVTERPVPQESPVDFERAIQAIIESGNLDIVYVITTGRNASVYSSIKAQLLGNGVPSQVITASKMLNSRQYPWTLESLALQSYAKIGGTPWTVASRDKRRELVIGISRALDRNKKYVVGFITLFTQDGDYLFMNSLAPKPIGWENKDEYVESLSSLIARAYEDYKGQKGEPESVVLHLCKRPGKSREVEAVQKAMAQIGGAIPFALIHINDDSNFRLFDTTHPTHVPESGLKVDLSETNSLLFLDGRVNDQRRARGMPRVLDIYMDRRSTMAVTEFPRIINQIHDFARVNWRGFNARAIPVTLNYSHLVARLVSEIGSENWNAIIASGRLKDKAWFL